MNMVHHINSAFTDYNRPGSMKKNTVYILKNKIQIPNYHLDV